MMTTSRSVVQTGKVVGEQGVNGKEDCPKKSALVLPVVSELKCYSRSVCGRSFDQRQVGHVILVFHAGSAFSCDHAGRAPRRGQTLRPNTADRLLHL